MKEINSADINSADSFSDRLNAVREAAQNADSSVLESKTGAWSMDETAFNNGFPNWSNFPNG